MKKGIVVTSENMMTLYDHLKKVVEKKKFLVGRNFYTRSMKQVNKIASFLWQVGGGNQTQKCPVSHAMFGISGIFCDGSRIWLNRSHDYGYFYIQVGNKVFIDPTGRIFIERTDFQIHGKGKFILLVQERDNTKL